MKIIVLKCEFTTIGTFGNFQSLNDRCPAPSTLKQPTLDIDVGSFFAFSIIHNLQSLVWNCFQFALRFTFKLSNIKYEKRRMEPGFPGIFCGAGNFSWDILCRRILWKMSALAATGPHHQQRQQPPLCYISLIHEPAIMGNERGEGCSLVKVWGVEGILKMCWHWWIVKKLIYYKKCWSKNCQYHNNSISFFGQFPQEFGIFWLTFVWFGMVEMRLCMILYGVWSMVFWFRFREENWPRVLSSHY